MINIGIVGVGLVGSELIAQILKSSFKEDLKIVAISTSQKMILSCPDYTSLDFKQPENARKIVTQDGCSSDLAKLANYLSESNRHSVIVDCTASEEVSKLYPSWLQSGLSIVTPNKKGFSSSLELFKEIQRFAANTNKRESNIKTPLIYHEATVGAGLPILSTLSDLVKTGDEIIRIEGVFSGTLSYLFNNFSSLANSSEQKFSKIVAVAKNLGYTEPDPRDDLNGMDVARKVIICGRLAGLDLDLSSLRVENIVPKDLQSLQSAEEFMTQLPIYDDYFAKLNQEASENKEVLRYVGTVDMKGNDTSVKLIKCPASHPFASLQGSDNIIKFTTKYFPNGIVIQGAGAGATVTAYGIFTDLIKIQERVE